MVNERFIDINLGNECNFRCAYCYEDNMEERTGSISEEVIDKTISFVEGLLSHYKNTVFVLNFWGGEPLLHTKQMLLFLEHFCSNPRIKFMMITNGSLIHKHKDMLLKYHHKFMIQVSYDFEPCNSKNRTTWDTSEKIRENMLWLDENYFNWWIKTTMFTHDLSTSLYDTYMDFVSFRSKLRNTNITMNITPDTRVWTNQIFDLSGIEKEMKRLILYFIENKIETTYFTWFDRYSKAECHSPKGGCLVDIDGKVYPCHGCSYMKPDIKNNFMLYSVYDVDCVDKFVYYVTNFDIHQPEKCKKCDTWLCYRCNSSVAQMDDRTIDSWNNPNPDYQCKIYKTISKYIYAYKKIMNKGV